MLPGGPARPVIVCLNAGQDLALLVHCGVALASLFGVPLLLAVALILPPSSSLEDDPPPGEERHANRLLDLAVQQATGSGIVPAEEIWIGWDRKEVIQQMAEELEASALLIGSHSSGPVGLAGTARALLRRAPCPVLVVGGQPSRQQGTSWPPRWLAEAGIHLDE